MDEREDIVILTDEDGIEREFRHVDTLEYNDTYYVALSPNVYDDGAQLDEEAEEEVYIMKIVMEDGEEILEIVDDDDELNEVFEEFQKLDDMDDEGVLSDDVE